MSFEPRARPRTKIGLRVKDRIGSKQGPKLRLRQSVLLNRSMRAHAWRAAHTSAREFSLAAAHAS
eukprot:2046854-Pleurochrysis_carterae.AAC.4